MVISIENNDNDNANNDDGDDDDDDFMTLCRWCSLSLQPNAIHMQKYSPLLSENIEMSAFHIGVHKQSR